MLLSINHKSTIMNAICTATDNSPKILFATTCVFKTIIAKNNIFSIDEHRGDGTSKRRQLDLKATIMIAERPLKDLPLPMWVCTQEPSWDSMLCIERPVGVAT